MHLISSSPSPLSWVTCVLALLPSAFASPILPKRSSNIQLGLNADFPDPSIVQLPGGKWYAYGTNGTGKRIQVAESDDFNSWNLLDIEALPTFAPWETGNTNYAPDVVLRVSLTILYPRLLALTLCSERWQVRNVLLWRSQE